MIQTTPLPEVQILDIPLYDCQVHILIREHGDEILEFVENVYGHDDDNDAFQAQVFGDYFLDDKTVFVIGFVERFINEGLVAHECYHVVVRLFRLLGINDEEASAYLLDYIVKNCHISINQILSESNERKNNETTSGTTFVTITDPDHHILNTDATFDAKDQGL